VLLSPLPLTYHLPALYGFDSLRSVDPTTVRGAIVLGSAASVNDGAPWQNRLEGWLGDLWSRSVPTLGICYGHQLIARMFGGTVDYAFSTRARATGFRQVALEGAPPWAGAAREVTLCVSHREAVVQCPPELQVFARSKQVAADGLAHRELPIWGLQPHPEATPVFLEQHGISVEGTGGLLSDGHRLLRGYLEFCASL
jgi:GMP synthase (glutamine-hydrolysing)